MDMSNPVVFLENSVENAAALPPELSRILALVKNLDERVEELRTQQQLNYSRCCAYPPHYTLKPETALHHEVADLRQQLIKDDVSLVQWSEEKLSLCCIARDLLGQHIEQLDKDLQGLESELDGVSIDMEDDYDPMSLAEQERQERQMALEAEAEEREIRRKEEDARRHSSSQGPPDLANGNGLGTYGSGSSYAPDASFQTSSGIFPGNATPDLNAKAQELEQKFAGRRGQRDALPTARPELNSNRKAAQAAVDAAAHALAQEDGIEDDGFGYADDAQGPAPYMPVLPPGMQTSAPKPQAPGRLLTYADINESLRGRRAELFWPDDNLWYLIEIHDLDLDNNKAQIMYITGETEELLLTEIVHDGHMSLISTSSL